MGARHRFLTADPQFIPAALDDIATALEASAPKPECECEDDYMRGLQDAMSALWRLVEGELDVAKHLGDARRRMRALRASLKHDDSRETASNIAHKLLDKLGEFHD